MSDGRAWPDNRPLPTGPVVHTHHVEVDEFDQLDAGYRCTCYDPISMEYGPDYPCARCRRDNEGIPG